MQCLVSGELIVLYGVCTLVYVCAYAYTHACRHTLAYTYSYTHTYPNAGAYTHTHARTQHCTHSAHTHAHTHTNTHIIAVGWFCRSCLGQQSQSFTLLFSTWSGCLVKFFCWWHRNCSQGRRKRVYITCMISVRPALKTETHTPGLPPPPILVYYFCCRFQTKN